MTPHECPRESDVLDAVASARWPDRVSPALVAHVAGCPVCADVAVVALALRDDQDHAWQEASVPSSGQVWWRAEMRAKQEAIRAASRPIAIAQWVSAALILWLTLVVGVVAWRWIRQQAPTFDFASVSAQAMTSPLALSLVVAFGALLLITPLALYLVLSDE